MPSCCVIGDHFEAFIKKQIEQARCASASEVVREGLRLLSEREEHRKQRIAELNREIEIGYARPRVYFNIRRTFN